MASTGSLPFLAAPSGTLTYDYTNQAWVKDGRYLRCGHTVSCACYGRIHEGEPVQSVREQLEASLALVPEDGECGVTGLSSATEGGC